MNATIRTWMRKMTEMSEKEKEQLIVKRVVKAQVWIILDDDVIKALGNNIPIVHTLSEGDMNIVKEAMRSKGNLEINLIRKDP